MDLQTLRETLRLEYDYPDLEKGWAASQRCYPNTPLLWVTDAYLNEAFVFAAIPDEIRPAFTNAAHAIRSDETLQRLFWHCRQELFVEEQSAAANQIVPMPEAAMGNEAGMLRALVVLSSIPYLQTIHGLRNIPESYTRAAFRDLTLWMQHFQHTHSAWGLAEIAWLLTPFRKRLFRIGRLEFMPAHFNQPLLVCHHRSSHETLALFDRPIRFRGDGQRDGVNNIFDSEGGWTTACNVTETTITGNPADPRGCACHESVELDRSEWDVVLDRHAPVLDIHIPEDGSLDMAACGAALQDGLDFFKRYFPDETVKGFVCTSWLLDGQLADLLPDHSNIARFLKEFYLFPTQGGEAQTLERVFGTSSVDLDTAPQKSSLQRCLLAHLRQGGRFRSGGGFLLADTLSRWGERPFRTEA